MPEGDTGRWHCVLVALILLGGLVAGMELHDDHVSVVVFEEGGQPCL